MIEALVVTLFPVAFLTVLVTGGGLFRRKRVDMHGDAPIDRTLFYGSKYLMLALWVVTVLDSWGMKASFFNVPAPLRRLAVCVPRRARV